MYLRKILSIISQENEKIVKNAMTLNPFVFPSFCPVPKSFSNKSINPPKVARGSFRLSVLTPKLINLTKWRRKGVERGGGGARSNQSGDTVTLLQGAAELPKVIRHPLDRKKGKLPGC